MSTLSGGPGPIVTNGLVLYFDAANPNAAPTRNLLIHTTDLTNAAWTKTRCSITASAAIAPDGTNTAFAFNMSTGSTDLKRLTATNTTSAVSGGLYTFSVFVKQNNFSGSGNASAGIQLGNYNSSQNAGVEPAFNVLSNFQPTGSFVFGPASSGSAVDRGAIDVGNGWYRIYVTCNWASSVSSFSTFIDMDNGILTGSQYGGTGVYIWGPQFETGYLSSYQPVTGTTKPWPSIGSTITGSMVNNPTWISSNGGSVVFDGVNDYVSISNSTTTQFSNTDPWSFSIITELLSQNAEYPSILNKGSAATTGLLLYYFSSGSIVLKHNNLQPNPIIVPMNRPFVYTATYSGSGAVKIYLNGIYRVDGPTMVSVDTTNNLTLGFGDAYSNIRVYNFSKYNRALTQQEITQNYNALKSRYGLS